MRDSYTTMPGASSPSSPSYSRVVHTFLELAALPSPARHEEPVAAYVRGFLDDIGVAWSEDAAAAAIPAGCGNITARIPATAEGTPIFLCSHLDTVALEDDVVPVISAEGRITNERAAILGGDNKAAVAVMLELLRELAHGGMVHAGVEVVFTPCEEIGLLGAKHYNASQLVANYGFVFDHADDIGKVVNAAPTQMSFTARFVGVASHSGIAPELGRSAIRAAAEAIARMPHGRIDTETTVNVGLIEGGTAVNIVPEECTLRGEVRSIDPGSVQQVTQQVLDTLASAANLHNTELHLDVEEAYRGYRFRDSAPVMQHALDALRAEGYEPELVPCGGGSDANIFNAVGMPCVNMCNAMRRIHTRDEYMDAHELDAMLGIARALMARALEPTAAS